MDAYLNAVDVLSREVNYLAHSAHAFMPVTNTQASAPVLPRTSNNVYQLPMAEKSPTFPRAQAV